MEEKEGCGKQWHKIATLEEDSAMDRARVWSVHNSILFIPG